MQLSNHDAERLAKEGVDALQRGHSAIARARFETITHSGRANAQIWLLVAVACRADNESSCRTMDHH